MIHIIDKYYARVDEHQFIVGVPVDQVRKDGTTQTVLRDCKYYGSFESALQGTYKRLSREVLQSVDGDLKDAVSALERLVQQFQSVVDRVTLSISVGEDDGK